MVATTITRVEVCSLVATITIKLEVCSQAATITTTAQITTMGLPTSTLTNTTNIYSQDMVYSNHKLGLQLPVLPEEVYFPALTTAEGTQITTFKFQTTRESDLEEVFQATALAPCTTVTS